MCGIGTGKLQSADEPVSSSAQTLLGIEEPNSTAPPAAAALPKKLRREKRARNWEAGEVLFIPASSFLFLYSVKLAWPGRISVFLRTPRGREVCSVAFCLSTRNITKKE